MYEVTVYWLDDRERKHLLGSVKVTDKTKDAARETAMKELWHNHLEAPSSVDFQELNAGELNELARGNAYLQDNCPICTKSNGIHEVNAERASWDERLCNSCYEEHESSNHKASSK